MPDNKQNKSGENTMNLKTLTDDALQSHFENLVSLEKKTLAQLLECLREIDSRKLYLKLGFTSLFAYLTKSQGYSESSALRRIEAARLLNAVPEIKTHLESGALNLMQISIVAQGLRQKQKEQHKIDSSKHIQSRTLLTKSISSSTTDKRNLLMKVVNQDTISTQKIVSETLDLEIKTIEKKSFQKDESLRLEITLTKQQLQKLERVKELISHTHPNPSVADLICFLSTDYLKRKDPLLHKQSQSQSQSEKTKQTNPATENNNIQSRPDNPTSRMVVKKSADSSDRIQPHTGRRTHIPIRIQRLVHQKHQHCQWKDQKTNMVCGSKFQMQIDHIKAISNGGGNEIENLQILCSAHNKLKYLRKDSP